MSSWVVLGARVMWVRHGVVAVARFVESAGERFVIVEPVGWSGEAGWIVERAIDIHLRPLSSIETCKRWLAELRNNPRPAPGALLSRRRHHRAMAEEGTPDEQATALAQMYAEEFRPDHEDYELLDLLERAVLVEIACVLRYEISILRAELRDRPRFKPDAKPSGLAYAQELRRFDVKQAAFSSFEVRDSLHITNLDSVSLRVPVISGTWHAATLGRTTRLLMVDSERTAWPLDARDGRHLIGGKETGGVLAILDSTALDDPIVARVLERRLSIHAKHRGAAIFEPGGFSVFIWERLGRCFAMTVTIFPPQPPEERPPPVLAFPAREQYVLRFGHEVVFVEEIAWTEEERPGVVVRVRDGEGALVTLPAHEIEKKLRPLIDRPTAERALGRSRTSHSPRPPGTPAERDHRYRDTIMRGTFDEQVAALAHIYTEPHRFEGNESETLARLERLVLGEVARVLDQPLDTIIARARHGHARFADDAPASADIVPDAIGPALPRDYRWISTFDVERTLQVTDLTDNTLSFAAQPGRWHGAWCDGAVVVIADSYLAQLPFADGARQYRMPGCRNFAIAVLDAGALKSSVISNALIEGTHEDVMGRGVAWLPTKDPVAIRVWEHEGVCVAIEIRTELVVS